MLLFDDCVVAKYNKLGLKTRNIISGLFIFLFGYSFSLNEKQQFGTILIILFYIVFVAWCRFQGKKEKVPNNECPD